MKAPFVTHADMESLLVKIDNCQNNPEKTSTVKINSHRPSGFPMFTHWPFDVMKNKLDYYRGNDFMKMFCRDLRKQVMKITNFEEKKWYY